MRVYTLGEVAALVNDDIPSLAEWNATNTDREVLRFFRKYWMPHVKVLTRKLADQLLGRKLCVLMGQFLFCSLNTFNRDKKLRLLEEITIYSFDEYGHARDSDGDGGIVYDCCGVLSTGSGADPVYVFVGPANKVLTDILALPDEVLLHIAALLTTRDRLCVLPLVCKRWHMALTANGAAWRALHLDLKSMDTRKLAACIAWLGPRAAHVRSLGLHASYRSMAGSVLALVRHSISTVQIEGFLHPADVAALSTCSGLTSLKLHLGDLSTDVGEEEVARMDASLGLLSRLSGLRHLELYPWAGPEMLSGLSNLVCLTIAADDDVTLANLPAFHSLQRLDLSSSGDIELDITTLCAMTSLTSLDLSPKGQLVVLPGDADAGDMQKLAALTMLSVRQCREAGSATGWELFAHLPGLHVLWTNSWSALQLPGTGSSTTRLTRLQHLGVREGLADLPAHMLSLVMLRRLELHCIGGMQQFPSELSQLASLQVLVLSGRSEKTASSTAKHIPFKLTARDIGSLPAIQTLVLAHMGNLQFRQPPNGRQDYALLAHHKTLQHISVHGSQFPTLTAVQRLVAFTNALAARGRGDLVTFGMVNLPNIFGIKCDGADKNGPYRFVVAQGARHID